jgi:hypothetical protein
VIKITQKSSDYESIDEMRLKVGQWSYPQFKPAFTPRPSLESCELKIQRLKSVFIHMI